MQYILRNYTFKVASGSVELAIGQLPYSWDFFQRADIINTVGFRRAHLTYGEPKPISAVWTIFYPFETFLWIAIVIVTLITSLSLLYINDLAYNEKSPSNRIIAICLLTLLNENFSPKWLKQNISSQVMVILYFWLPMSFLIGCVYRSSLLIYLVAGDLEDPPDTFEKVIERDLIIVMPTGTLFEQMFKTAPYESMRQAYIHGLDKGGYIPWNTLAPEWLESAVSGGKGVAFFTEELQIGNRHRSVMSKKEPPVVFMMNGFLFKRNSPLQLKIQPILMSLTDSGTYEHLKDKFLWNRAKRERDFYRSNHEENLVVLTWDHVGWTYLLVACSGLALAALAFITEVKYCKRMDNYTDRQLPYENTWFF